jgi:hypothetical protein
MEYQDIYNVVNANNGKKFSIIYADGKKIQKRMFISTCNDICEFAYRSRTKGRMMSLRGIVSVQPILVTSDTRIRKCRNNLKNVIKYLTASGFWTPMLNGAKYFLNLTDEELLALCDYDHYHKVMNELRDNDIKWFGSDSFSTLFHKPIKTMNFDKYDREFQKKRLAEKIANKVNTSHRWVNGYDNSYEVRFDSDYPQAWYSEEFRGCCNGHYYYLLDNCHAIFGEDD